MGSTANDLGQGHGQDNGEFLWNLSIAPAKPAQRANTSAGLSPEVPDWAALDAVFAGFPVNVCEPDAVDAALTEGMDA